MNLLTIKNNFHKYIKELNFDILELQEYERFEELKYYVCLRSIKEDIKDISILICPICKKTLLRKGKKYCSRQCSGKSKFGLKRPNHSKLMKQKCKDGIINIAFLNQQGKNKDFLKSLEFKKKRLKNKNINIDKMTDIEIKSEYSNLLSKINSSNEFKLKSLLTFLSNRTEYIFDPFLKSILHKDFNDILNDPKIEDIIFKLNSFKTCLLNPNININSFKRTLMSNFKFNSLQESVYTKSSYETNYINFFEKEGINWTYEKTWIITEKGYYLPDFKVFYNNNEYLIEVKGSFFRTTLEEYVNNKVIHALKHCQNNNMKFIFTFNGNPNFNIFNKELKDRNIQKLIKTIKHLRKNNL